MWSGPRNLSTALMYSFAARGDCAVTDEPFYGAYLDQTGLDHPMRAEVLAEWPTDASQIARSLLSDPSDGHPIWYQKHMTKHMIPGMPTDWMSGVANVFLLRHPARVIASYHNRTEQVNMADIGYDRQVELYYIAKNLSPTDPIVIDSYDIRKNPEYALKTLCDLLKIRFSENMLSWPKGGIPEDGPWAPHWYKSVWESTGFAGPEGPLPELSGNLSELCKQAMPFYEELANLRIRF